MKVRDQTSRNISENCSGPEAVCGLRIEDEECRIWCCEPHREQRETAGGWGLWLQVFLRGC